MSKATSRKHRSQITKAERPKKVLIIGGGVGGMEAARVADLRGHDVTLWERGPQLGGQVANVSKMPNLFVRSLNNSVEWISRQLYTASLITTEHVIPEKAGIQKNTGFRVKPGMTAAQDLCRHV